MNRASRHAWSALLVTLFAGFMDALDLSITAVANPAMQRDLHAGYNEAQWFVAAYALAFAVMLIPGGRLGDIYGRRRILLTGVAGFTLASAACALAPSPLALIAARLVQGGFGALMVPQVLAAVQLLFPAERRGPALAAYGTVMNLAQITGPVLGGFLTTDNVLGLGWRAVFLINLPVGLLVLAGTALLLPESRSDRPLQLDMPGALLAGLFSGLVVYPLQQGRADGWPPWLLAALVAALPVGYVFVRQQRRRAPERALVPVGLFRNRAFCAGMVQLLLVYSAILAQQMPVIWHTQTGLGWSALRTGTATVGWVLGLCVLGVPAVALAPRAGRALQVAGCLVVVSGTLLLSEVIGHHALGFWSLFGCLTVIGCGLGLVVPTLISMVLAGVPGRDAGGAAGLANAAIYFAAAAGVGLIGMVFFGRVADTGVAAGGPAQVRVFSQAAAYSLYYPAAAFLAVPLLAPFLPRGTASGGSGGRHRGRHARRGRHSRRYTVESSTAGSSAPR
ncbi:MFS transporter [Streptomyces sp. RB6PN25]|uniref:MFS transporter n=1 Tax=Streptomyces humicola TaxID=2953240 RepID=A0ABT1Q2S4_9ACTN|nr:MFS transporter [Streptomyces humicola]MCQ4084237.1 MFS transporter [Streptomyces humicola]